MAGCSARGHWVYNLSAVVDMVGVFGGRSGTACIEGVWAGHGEGQDFSSPLPPPAPPASWRYSDVCFLAVAGINNGETWNNRQPGPPVRVSICLQHTHPSLAEGVVMHLHVSAPVLVNTCMHCCSYARTHTHKRMRFSESD